MDKDSFSIDEISTFGDENVVSLKLAATLQVFLR